MPVIEKKGVPYEHYAEHQGSKTRIKRVSFLAQVSKRVRKFELIFKRLTPMLNPGNVLCLGARTGCEVRAARKQGFKGSIGVDIEPARKNDPLVLQMDWHQLTFENESFNNAFTNAIDHCYDLDKMTGEVLRVLKPGGIYAVMTAQWQSLEEKENKQEYMRKSSNYLFWDSARDLAEKLAGYGFEIVDVGKHGKSWNVIVLRKLQGKEAA